MTAHREKHLEDLLHADLFQTLDHQKVEEIWGEATLHHLNKGDFVFFQGDPAENVYFLLEGQVKLTLSNSRGDQVSVQHVAPGETFALIGAFRKAKYPVSAKAIADGEIFSWNAQRFKELCADVPELSANSTRIISDRSIDFQSRILELSSEKVERRIAHALLRLAHQMGKKSRSGVVIDLNLTRQDIAELSGTTLFTASRTLSKWQNEKIIRCSKERVLIMDAHKLVDIAEDLPSKYKSLID